MTTRITQLGEHARTTDKRDSIIRELTSERDRWKSNHDAQVQRARILHDRPDCPLERVQAYKQVGLLTAERDVLTLANRDLIDWFDALKIDHDKLLERIIELEMK